MRILITGANGFLGLALIKQLETQKVIEQIYGLQRVRNSTPLGQKTQIIQIENLAEWTDTQGRLKQIDVIVHCAARVHQMKEHAQDPVRLFREANVQGTLNLAKQAAEHGVKRFIFLSSLKVNGESTSGRKPFTAQDTPHPEDFYAQSKWEAEQGLHQISEETGLEYVIIRPPLVYGPGVQANFKKMLDLVEKNYPLPLGAITNQRSYVGLNNLIHLIIHCLDNPKAANETFMASDGQDISTTALLYKMAQAFGKKPIYFPIPMKWIQKGAALIGLSHIAERVCGSLQVDIQHTCESLNWTPPFSLDEQLAEIAQYRAHNKK